MIERESLPHHKANARPEPVGVSSLKSISLRSLAPVIVFFWPFVYFFNLIVPLGGSYTGIDNDFYPLYYSYKVYLLDHLIHFQIPLWSPAEAAGYPFYTNPFTQTFYPFNLCLAAFYYLAGGYTPLDHQIFTVLGVSIFALGLFFWLRSLGLNLRAALFATLVMSVSFKVSEHLRLPNAVHTAAWYPWILFAITRILQSQSAKESYMYGLLLLFVLICFLTGGYLYYAFYAPFLYGPYLLLFLAPKLRQRFFGSQARVSKASLIVLAVTSLVALLVCLPYLYKISRMLKETVDRAGSSFEFSTGHLFTFMDTIGSLIFPAVASAEGWYYFGTVSILILALYFFGGVAGAYSFRRVEGRLKPRVIALLIAGLTLLLLCAPYIDKVSRMLRARAGGGSIASLINRVLNVIEMVFPPAAQTTKYHHLAIACLLLLLIYLLKRLYDAYYSAPVNAGKASGAEALLRYQDPLIKIFFLVWIGLITWVSYGKYSYLFVLLWNYVPFFSSPRAWGKMNIILVPIIAWLLAIAYTHFEGLLFTTDAHTAKRYLNRSPALFLTGVYLLIIGVQIPLYFFKNKIGNSVYWAKCIEDSFESRDIYFLFFGFVAFLVMMALLRFARHTGSQGSGIRGPILCGLVLLSALDMRMVGPHMWTYPATETPRARLNVADLNLKSFTAARIDAYDTLSLNESFNAGVIANWYFNRYVQFRQRTEGETEARKELLGMADGRKLFFSEAINYQTIRAYLNDADRFKDSARVIAYTGDELTLTVHAPVEGYLSFIDNWDAHWRATVDDKPAPIELLFGTFKAVRLPAGEHRVTFVYRP